MRNFFGEAVGRLTLTVKLVVVLVVLLTLVQVVFIAVVSAYLNAVQDQRDGELLKSAVVKVNATSAPLSDDAPGATLPTLTPSVRDQIHRWLLDRGLAAWITDGKDGVFVGAEPPHHALVGPTVDPVPAATRQWLAERGLRAWVTAPSGRVLATLGLARSLPPPGPLTPGEPREVTNGNQQLMVVVDRFVPELSDAHHYLVVALDPLSSHAEVRLTVNALWLVLPLSLVLIGFVGFVMTRQALHPVEVINDTTEKISGRDLTSRIPVGPARDEVSRLAANINTMLDRIEASFERERQFNDDVSHELRTPLSALKTSLSLARSRPRDAQTLVTMMAAMEADVDRMSQLVVRMLELGRGLPVERGQATPLEGVVAACLERFAPSAQVAGVALVPGPFEGEAAISEAALEQILDNLVENALRHTPRGGRVAVTQGRQPPAGTVQILVVDTGCGIPSEHLAHVFERFYRVDNSRSRRTGGFGLGLAIVRSLAEAYAGKVSLQSQEGVGTQVTVELPCPPSPDRP